MRYPPRPDWWRPNGRSRRHPGRCARTRAVSMFTSGMAGVPARSERPSEVRPTSKPSAQAAAAMAATAARRDHAAARFGPGQRGFEIEHRLQHGRVGEDLRQPFRGRETLDQSREHDSILHVEEDGLGFALQTNLEAPGLGLAVDGLCQERGAAFFGNQCEYGIFAGWPARRRSRCACEDASANRARRR